MRVPTPPVSAPVLGYWTAVDLPRYRPAGPARVTPLHQKQVPRLASSTAAALINGDRAARAPASASV